MFLWKSILHPNLVFILHWVFCNHLLEPLVMLKNVVLLHQLPTSLPIPLPSYSNPFYMENFPKTCLSSVISLYKDILMLLITQIPCSRLGTFVFYRAPKTQFQPHDLVLIFSSNQCTFLLPCLSLLCHPILLYKYLIVSLQKLDQFPVISGSLLQVLSPGSVFQCLQVYMYLTVLKTETQAYSVFEHLTSCGQLLSLQKLLNTVR